MALQKSITILGLDVILSFSASKTIKLLYVILLLVIIFNNVY